MAKTFLMTALTTLFVFYSQGALAQHNSGIATQKETTISIVVENLVPHENAFDIMPAESSEIYHLENAARMSTAKMRALSTSLKSKSSVKLRVKGTDVIDIVVLP